MELEKERYPVLKVLDDAGVSYRLYTHQPVFTVGEGADLLSHIPGHGSKNLFLRDKKGKVFFLLTVAEETRVDLHALGDLFGFGRLSFASSERLMEYLSLEPGSVTPLGLLFDTNRAVRAYMDAKLYDASEMQIHPMKNDATIVLSCPTLVELLKSKGIDVSIIDVPSL